MARRDRDGEVTVAVGLHTGAPNGSGELVRVSDHRLDINGPSHRLGRIQLNPAGGERKLQAELRAIGKTFAFS
jgi:hypothetical protein